ncbi:hypothetical protein HAX54_014424 [Datura stramonium]|uniref:Uncharacterized protein n=1 Tax=Datura stramonium TaxID=4076 RepID=A0ABS8TN68_DATST|nr:hypothetical protein [Datura stramonium]
MAMRQFGILQDLPFWSLMAPCKDGYEALIPKMWMVEKDLEEPRAEEDPIEEDYKEEPKYNPNMYNSNDGGIMEMGPHEEPKNIPA